jgi:hypothetical protein
MGRVKGQIIEGGYLQSNHETIEEIPNGEQLTI